jgi:hypothetical protein
VETSGPCNVSPAIETSGLGALRRQSAGSGRGSSKASRCIRAGSPLYALNDNQPQAAPNDLPLQQKWTGPPRLVSKPLIHYKNLGFRRALRIDGADTYGGYRYQVGKEVL